MKQVLAEVLSNQQVGEGMYLMWLGAPAIARESQPGQFLLLRCGDGFDPLLRRALSIHRIGSPESGSEGSGWAVLYSLHGPGTAYLRQRKPGDTLDVLGPLGRGFSVHGSSRNLLLVANGWGVSPLVALAEQQVGRGRSVVLLAGAPNAALQYPAALLPPEVEFVVATDDGSAGHKGNIAAVVPQFWSWADEVYACGSMSMYSALARATEGLWPGKAVQVLAEAPMACGVGACFGCTVETRRGMKLACRDGPRIYLRDLLL